MKFSLISLLTMVAITAWCLRLYYVPDGYRGTYVAVSLLVVVTLMFLVAMVSTKNEQGMIETEQNAMLQVLEPMFRTVGVVCAIAVALLLILLFGGTIWLIATYAAS